MMIKKLINILTAFGLLLAGTGLLTLCINMSIGYFKLGNIGVGCSAILFGFACLYYCLYEIDKNMFMNKE